MGFLKRRQTTTADIHFLNDDNKVLKSPSWTTEETIKGVASFRFSPGIECTHATVALKGAVTISVNESHSTSLQPRWRTEKVKFLSVGKDVFGLERSGDGLKARFQFDLLECLRWSTLESGLPPSLDSRAERSDLNFFPSRDSKVAYDISYTVTAAAASGSTSLVSSSQRISILPAGDSDPPSYGSLETPGEYRTASAEPSPRSRGLQVDVAGQEPSPLVMRTSAGAGKSDPTTSIDLLLKMSSEDAHALSNLPQQVQIRSELVQTTRVSPNGAALQAAGKGRVSDPDAQLRESKRNVQDYTLAVSNWETYRPDHDTPGFAIARLSFLYRHPVTDRLTATFSTPILSRRYALDVKVSFSESALQDLKLQLPVQVTWEAADSELSDRDSLEWKSIA